MRIDELWIYGDSLSTGTHGENAYLDALTQRFGIKRLRNFAVGSSGLTLRTPNSMVSILKRQLEEDFCGENGTPQVILIWHGSNDWYWGSDLEQFRRDVCWVVDALRERFPDALIVWPTPIFRLETPDGMSVTADAYKNPNRNGNVMGDFVKALRDCSTLCHFPVIDMGRRVNIHMFNEGVCLEDHVHPNAEGYRRIANVLCREIEACAGDAL